MELNVLDHFLRRKRGAAAATAGCIWIVECESRAHHIRRVVDRDAIEILGREHIDKQPDAGFVHYKIAGLRLFLNIQTVLKSRAASRDDADAKSSRFRQVVLASQKLLDLIDRAVGDCQFNGRCCNC